jgi:hypothetical protein
VVRFAVIEFVYEINNHQDQCRVQSYKECIWKVVVLLSTFYYLTFVEYYHCFQPWLNQLVSLSPWRPKSVCVGFVVDIVAQGQVFLRVLRLFPVNIIPQWLSILIYLGDEQ